MTLGGRHLTNAISTKLKKTAPADLPQTFGCYRICRSTRRSRRMVILLRTRTSLLAWRPFVQLTVLRCVPSCPVRIVCLYTSSTFPRTCAASSWLAHRCNGSHGLTLSHQLPHAAYPAEPTRRALRATGAGRPDGLMLQLQLPPFASHHVAFKPKIHHGIWKHFHPIACNLVPRVLSHCVAPKPMICHCRWIHCVPRV